MNKGVFYKLFFILIFFMSCKTSADKFANYLDEGYYKNIYKADSLFIIEDYENSYKLLNSTFSKFTPLNMEQYDEMVTYLKLKIVLKEKINYKDYTDLVSKYGYSFDFLTKDSILNKYYLNVKERFNRDYSKLSKQYYSSLNKELIKKILYLKEIDQWVRKNNFSQQKMDSIDLIHEKELKKIFNQFGYPSHHLVGKNSISNNVSIKTLLLHTDDSIRINYFMPKVLSYIKEGKASPYIYGVMKDQYLLYNDQEQYYGTYTTRKPISVPIKELNNRRESIGLPNYGYDKWRMMMIYGITEEF